MAGPNENLETVTISLSEHPKIDVLLKNGSYLPRLDDDGAELFYAWTDPPYEQIDEDTLAINVLSAQHILRRAEKLGDYKFPHDRVASAIGLALVRHRSREYQDED